MPVTVATAPFDVSAEERTVTGLVDALRGDPGTRVLLVSGDRAPVSRGHAALSFVAPDDVAADAEWAFLGRDSDGVALLLAAVGERGSEEIGSDGAAFREVGASLPPHEAELFVTAVALGRWLVEAAFCPGCGERTRTTMAGWARHCDGCGREHFPRTDPAVIVGITSADDERLLLGANAAWGGRMFSCFAGFIEAGESAEQTIHRELAEEAGVRVRDLRYIASQAWPYPRSLMLGFHVTAVDEDEARPDGEEIIETRWFTREEIGRALRGEGDVSLPGGVSVAHHLIRAWHDAGPGGEG